MQIHIDAEQGNIPGVAHQIASGVDIDSTDNFYSNTPLMCAISSSKATSDMVKFLLDNGADIEVICGEHENNVLSLAVQSGSLDKVRLILDAGANINYQRPNGYHVLIDAINGCAISTDREFLSILSLLIERGAELSNVSIYSKSAVSFAAQRGRYDAVKLLLEAGADASDQWAGLMQAIACEDVENVKVLLAQNPDLSARDCWSRTPWLLSLEVGKLETAKLLLSAGADRSDRGHCGQTPLMYPIENDKTEVLEWLIEQGFDIEATDDFNTTPLILAAECGATDCVRILLENGANPSRINNCSNKAIKLASNLQIVRMLVDVGEDLSDISDDMRSYLTGVGNYDLEVTLEQYLSGRERRFGKTNPEVMEVDFWKAMILSGTAAGAAELMFSNRDTYNPPVWCYQRFGRTITELPDGRIIEIAGEHEDHYDPNFGIYNDVVVYDGHGKFKILGYPKEVFPPTDFHSATLVGEYIYIIGNLGYLKDRNYNETPVYRLHHGTFKIEKLETTGDKPKWICRHKAHYKDQSKILITGGKVSDNYVDNSIDYILDLTTLIWNQVNTHE